MNPVEKILASEVERQKTPSVQYFFFNKDQITYKFQKGFADIRREREVNDSTTYHAYSVTKTFTAIAILQLAERGMLTIHEPVAKYLPGFPYSDDITIKQVLAHSSGIPNPMPLGWIHLVTEHESFHRNDFFNKIFTRHNHVKSNPNQKYAYSNLGYIILGQLIETTSGISYEQFIRENIFDRLNFQPEEMEFTIGDLNKNAKGYHRRISLSGLLLGLFIKKSKYMGGIEGKWKVFNDFYVNGVSYGGLIGTPRAFVRYVQELLKPECNLLSDEFRKLLFTENLTNSGKSTSMCLSWFKGELNGQHYFTHAGGGGGYYCEIRIYPALELGSVILFNRTGMRDERFLDKVDKYFFQ